MNFEEYPFTYFDELDPEGEVLAKADGETLAEHSRKVAEIAYQLSRELFIHPKFADYDDVIRKLIVFTAYLHDAGKAEVGFQERLKGERLSSIPHPLASLPIALDFLEKHFSLSEKAKDFFLSIALFAIANHHSPYSTSKYEKYADSEVNYVYPFSGTRSPYDIFSHAEDMVIAKSHLPGKCRRYIYVLVAGILNLADWLASGDEKPFVITGERLRSSINEYFLKKGIEELYDYQKKAEGEISDVMIQLPTGSGKTETALYWLSAEPRWKVFYTLPTVTTVEAMRERFEEIFRKEGVSFSHHLVQISLMKEERLGWKELIAQRYLLRPIAVTTIDQILLALMNYRRYPLIEVMLNNSALIVDEIHSYSPYTFSLIVEGLRYLKEYHNIRVCVMSATFPKLLKEELSRVGGDERSFVSLTGSQEVDAIYKSFKRTRIDSFYRGESIENSLEKVMELSSRARKVLIVVNTVSKAQDIYKRMKGQVDDRTKLLLFHGRFIYKDRVAKQEEIERIEKEGVGAKRIILIATQIVEVSLDIDYDILITELAPIDALIQRAGRVNRRGRKKGGMIYIFDLPEDKTLPYKLEQIGKAKELLERFGEIKSERDYISLNEEYYKVLEPIYRSELKSKKLSEIMKKFSETEGMAEVFKTRDGFLTIPVVPLCFREEIERIEDNLKDLGTSGISLSREELEDKRLRLNAEKLSYFMPLAIWNAKKAMVHLDSETWVPFVDLPYDPEIGLNKEGKKVEIII